MIKLKVEESTNWYIIFPMIT